ncbi:uncharacterized protein LOC121377702 [Gigantopelta aegis]|uniref:uncharacterized protein LOC121377702 n=1 Tax=Gigantopelta aegis TaxID=1735272 RepID=UPI001B88CBE9|nr:uncharacterized protein LOC121377702 [Gigantopelta aegis]
MGFSAKLCCLVIVVAAVVAAADAFSVRQEDLDAAVKLVEELRTLEQGDDVVADDVSAGTSAEVADANSQVDDVAAVVDEELGVDGGNTGDDGVQKDLPGDRGKHLGAHLKAARDEIKQLMTDLKDGSEDLIEKIQDALNEMDVIFNKIIKDDVLPAENPAGGRPDGGNGVDNGGLARRGFFSNIAKKLKNVQTYMKKAASKVADKAKAISEKISDVASKAAGKVKKAGKKVKSWSERQREAFIDRLRKLLSGK